MRISLHTICLLKNLGDEEARIAYRDYRQLESDNSPLVPIGTFWTKDHSFSVGLIWKENVIWNDSITNDAWADEDTSEYLPLSNSKQK